MFNSPAIHVLFFFFWNFIVNLWSFLISYTLNFMWKWVFNYLYIKMQYQSRKKNLTIKWEKSNRVQHSTSYLQINALIWYRNDYNDNSGTGISPSLFHTHSHTNSPNDKRKTPLSFSFLPEHAGGWLFFVFSFFLNFLPFLTFH